ncbi:MAG: FGGY family carbohydrate kinase, partial [Rhizomicrobium sp.]
NAIVWQDRRTAEVCDRLKEGGLEPMVAEKTGLLLDPYFSATKISWLLDRVNGARARARRGELAFGTVESFLLWRLTGGRVHASDLTNACRTLLCNIENGEWDEDLLKLFDVPRALLPDIRECRGDFGLTDPALLGAAIPIRGLAGDQQAAGLGQACFAPGMLKSTYGTGGFAVLNTGPTRMTSTRRLLATVAYRLDGRTVYALEGSIFVAGAAIQWLRDGLGVISSAEESGALAAKADPGQAVYLVPAFTGLGAPWWDANARGAIFGLTRNTSPRELTRAALDAVCYQTLDLWEAMRADGNGVGDTVLRVDGGMAGNDWMLQRLADILEAPVDRPRVRETTALGAAWLAGSAAGVWPDQEGFARSWRCERRFLPRMARSERTGLVTGWHDAVARTRSK